MTREEYYALLKERSAKPTLTIWKASSNTTGMQGNLESRLKLKNELCE